MKSRNHRKNKTPKKQKSFNWQLLVRSIDSSNIPIISHDKVLYPPLISKKWVPGVYTYYLSNQLNTNYLSEWALLDYKRNNNIVLVFDPKILKDLPFSICDSMNYGKCINQSISKEERQKYLLLNSKGNMKKNPNMNHLVKHINKLITPQLEYDNDGNEIMTYSDFTYSHEIIFDYIPIQYIKAIIIHDLSYKKEIEFYLPNIPVVIMPKPQAKQTNSLYIKNIVFPILKHIILN